MYTDCYSSNILSELLPFDDWPNQDIYACIGQPIKYCVRHLNGEWRKETVPEYPSPAI